MSADNKQHILVEDQNSLEVKGKDGQDAIKRVADREEAKKNMEESAEERGERPLHD